MRSFTYSEKQKIANIQKKLLDNEYVSDSDIVKEVTHYLYSAKFRNGFEFIIVRDAVTLCYYLLYCDERVKVIARGALLYLIKEDDLVDDNEEDGLHDDQYALSIAIKEANGILGNHLTYNCEILSDKHKEEIEKQLTKYIDTNEFPCDDVLISNSQKYISEIECLSKTSFFWRFKNIVTHFIDCLLNNRDDCNMEWIKAGLSYLIEVNDVIPNDLGVVGILDDRYAILLAEQKAFPESCKITEALNCVIKQNGFLAHTILNDCDYPNALSEYSLLNSGIINNAISGEHKKGINLILPSTGITPHLTGLLATLAQYNLLPREENVNLDDYKKGDKIKYNGQVMIFGGYEELNGKTYFSVKPAKSACMRKWPASIRNLARIMPAGKAKSNERIKSVTSFDSQKIEPIDRLLQTDIPIQFHKYSFNIIVVTKKSQEFCKGVRLFDKKICNVLPTGIIRKGGKIYTWGNIYGNLIPSLLFTESLENIFDSTVFANPENIKLIIIDTGTTNICDNDSCLEELINEDIRIITVTPESKLKKIHLENYGFDNIFWDNNEIFEVFRFQNESNGVIGKSESKISKGVKSNVKTSVIHNYEHNLAVNACNESLVKLRRLVEAEDLPKALFIDMWKVYNQLLQCVMTFSLNSALRKQIQNSIIQVNNEANEITGFSKVKATLREVMDSVEALSSALAKNNPKAELLFELMSKEKCTIVCRNSTNIEELQQSCIDHSISKEMSFNGNFIKINEIDTSPEIKHLVIPAWLNEGNMNKLISPPISSSVTLMFYELENEKYLSTKTSIRLNDKGLSVYSTLTGKSTKRNIPSCNKNRIDEFSANDTFYIHTNAHKRISDFNVNGDSAEKVNALFFLFSNGYYAWLSDGYRAKRVTHLIGDHAYEEDSEIDIISPSDLVIGDKLLFHTGADTDLIRTIADSYNSDKFGTIKQAREHATCWRKELLEYKKVNNCSIIELQEKLQKHGLKKTTATIANWLHKEVFSPMMPEKVLTAVIELTSSNKLRNNFSNCIEAMGLVRSAHLTASKSLARKVYHSFIESSHTNDIVNIDDSLIVLTVDDFDSITVPAPINIVDRIHRNGN
ncbi:MAG: hypothetical protein JEZ07_03475 [Phycisphaerae bacterium]|nr:hypothetical protein [Phycisphaerae bacterium]